MARARKAAVGRVAVGAQPPAAASTAVDLRSSRICGGGDGCGLGCRSSDEEPFVSVLSNLIEYNEFETVGMHFLNIFFITVIIQDTPLEPHNLPKAP